MKRKHYELKANTNLPSIANGALDGKCEHASSFKDKLKVNSVNQASLNEVHCYRYLAFSMLIWSIIKSTIIKIYYCYDPLCISTLYH